MSAIQRMRCLVDEHTVAAEEVSCHHDLHTTRAHRLSAADTSKQALVEKGCK
jgi:hypothetical protein